MTAYDGAVHNLTMGDQKPKVMKAWRLHPDVVEAIKRGAEKHGYPDETSFVETIFRRVLGLPETQKPTPQPPQISNEAMDLRV